MKIIGRENEIRELESLYQSESPEFLAIFGRRRVGKTFLVSETFANRFAFRHTALAPIDEDDEAEVTTLDQLNNFSKSLKRFGYDGDEKLTDWFKAFYALEKFLESLGGGRKVVFIDELPWLDTKDSKFVSAFEGFWNSYACNENILLIVCGSANAWMAKKLLNNYGGLYGRVTREMELLPLSLRECELFFKEKNMVISKYDIAQAYMVFGGIPYYLNMLDPALTLAQNIDSLFFKKGARLKNEFERLFRSTFKQPDLIVAIVKKLYETSLGISRQEIVKGLKIKEGGEITDALNALISSGFVMKYRPLKEDRKDLYYKLIDPFCLFHLRFVEGNAQFEENLFERSADSRKISTWRGLAFENICFNHIPQIKNALGISAVSADAFPFVATEDGKISSQIDLVLDRKDNIANLCEAKFYGDEYLLNKDEYLKLMRKDASLKKHIKKKSVVHNTLITTFGIRKGEYSSAYQSVITLEDLFR